VGGLSSEFYHVPIAQLACHWTNGLKHVGKNVPMAEKFQRFQHISHYNCLLVLSSYRWQASCSIGVPTANVVMLMNFMFSIILRDFFQ